MGKELCSIKVSAIFDAVHYEVPIYQRNYAWQASQINQLIDDINSSEDNYFLGTLIVNQRDNALYEVIDGQQRLTTLYLLERYLQMPLDRNALQFEARDKSNRTLAVVGTEFDTLAEELQSTEILDGYKNIEAYFKMSSPAIDRDTFIKKLDKVLLVRVQVPHDIDLNHYFEIMNTRGEQLELHEIVKANLIAQIKAPTEKRIANAIWEHCASMMTYVQMNFSINVRRKIFTKNWGSLAKGITNFDALVPWFTVSAKTEPSMTLADILKKRPRVSVASQPETPENERFESVLSFPNFLLQVNAALNPNNNENSDDASLDDRNLLVSLKHTWQDEVTAKAFIFNLLKARVLFDKYVLKREYVRDYKETGKWSLQRLERYRDSNGDKPVYHATFDEGDGDVKNKKIRTLQSALRITYTSPKTMHWITLILKKGLAGEITDILNVLETYARIKVAESNYKLASGFQFERIVFSYLDYLLYRDGYSYGGHEMIKPLADDWQFQFRNSIEHFFPQHPTELIEWQDDDLNGFGNLALITVSGNSVFSNIDPVGKVSTNPTIVEQSLKLKIMKAMLEQNGNMWTPKLSYRHQEEMFRILEQATSTD
ncbi:DUF262 domain-containing protein [Lactiplantibacillus garii]|uniref:DUF262 domain-containing protein n=1 Tax=Lactiplantibacillus garii TaxID=2306423 RepID=A0A426D5G2_9LACO|nr:DUF262 domain-containing protein [Lactiplantibacillus garii]RRK09852.1 DUF262 domain-containing protein [Lactiplantibacillus garii]